MSKPRIAFTLLCIGLSWAPCRSEALRFVFESSDVLPEVMIEGKSVKIHVQGLLVTARHYVITGRLETPPNRRRSLLLRFPRNAPRRYEWVDITPEGMELPGDADGATLDHPGGFDVDRSGNLVIPISTSHRKGPSVILGVRAKPSEPLRNLKTDVIAVLDDHIGAVCIDAKDDAIMGANWDTKHVYRWSKQGELQSKQPREKWLDEANDWHLAVQDWKATDQGRVIAGGIDKSQARSDDLSPAVIQLLDPRQGRIVWQRRMPTVPTVSRPVTNEGLCLFAGKLYLLPEDIGRGAKVLRYRVERSSTK